MIFRRILFLSSAFFATFYLIFLSAHDSFSLVGLEEEREVVTEDLSLRGRLLSQESHSVLIERLRERALSGDLGAQYSLGRAYVEGKGLDRDDVEALKFFTMAAEQGHAESQLMAGNLLIYGREVEHNVDRAEVYYESAARQGLTRGQYAYGLLLLSKTPSRVEEAKKWFAIASEKGDIDSSYELALLWFRDEETQKKSIDLLSKIAGEGHTQSEYAVGLIYDRGKGVKLDKKKAVFWYEKAASKGHEMSQLNLAKIYLNGDGVNKDIRKAMSLLEGSANKGVEEAQFMLGLIYGDESDLSIRNESKSFNWFLRAARLGHPYAQYNVGLMFSHGKGVNVDEEKSFYWFEKAADQGIESAAYQIALAHDEEQGKFYDRNKALELYEELASKGYAKALLKLGVMYWNGDFVGEDRKKGKQMIVKAFEKGLNSAGSALSQIDEIERQEVIENEIKKQEAQ